MTYLFTGTITGTFDGPMGNNPVGSVGPVRVGNVFTGSFSYTLPAPPDTNPTEACGVYQYAGGGAGMWVVIGEGATFETGSAPREWLGVYHTSTFDAFTFREDAPATNTGLMTPREMHIELDGYTGTVFVDTSVPESLSLDWFTERVFAVGAYDGDRPELCYQIVGRLETLERSEPVPEPSTVAFVVAGLLGAALRSRTLPSHV